jgi:lysophospholipase L1-like esterase
VKRRLATLSLLALTGIACWIAAELVVARLGLLEYAPSMSRGHPTRGYTLRAGYEGESKYGIPFRVSAQGFRTPEVAIPKPPGTKRVVVLGDSVTWGAGVREEETFARKLEVMLRSDLSCPVEVVNTGISGYGTVQELDVLQNEGLTFEPNVVIVFHIENDNQSVTSFKGGLAAFVKDHIVYRSWVISASLYAWRNAAWRMQASGAPNDEAALRAQQAHWDARPGTPASIEALRRIAAIGRDRGFPVLLASQPGNRDRSVDARRNAILRDVAREQQMVFLDMTPAFDEFADRDLSVSEIDGHPNGFAHGLIAERLRGPVGDLLDCAPRGGAEQ